MPLTNKSPLWFAVSTRSRFEKKVLKALEEKGIDAWLPLQKKMKQWSDRRKIVEEPLLRCYIFVRITADEYLNVLNTKGVVRFITFSGKAVPIPEEQISTLKKLVATKVEMDVTQEKLEVGDKVRVATGPLFGLTGHLVDYRGRQKVMMQIEQTGHTLLITIPRSFLEPVE